MPRPIVPFPAFQPGAPVIPKLYWDALSQEQRIHKICEALHKLCEYANQLAGGINADHVVIEQLLAEFEQFKDSGFEDYYEQQLNQWIQDNAPGLFESMAKLVLFGLDDDGHFVAYIPEGWSDITFDTGAVYGRSDYGRLILRFTADGSIDNSYSYSLAQSTTLEQLIADLEVDANRTDETYDAVFTNVSEVISNGNF